MSNQTAESSSGGFPRLKAGITVGPARFTLIKELGRGGMGVVWLAQDTNLGEQVALKFLPPEVCHDPVALNDLRRETVRSHRLTHPNIIRIHDFHQQADGVAFISMEYVDGMTLNGWRLQQAKQVFTWEQLAPLVKQLCAALEYAHGEGVIHRDLKPANVMMDRKGRVKLADFGIAAVVTDSMSRVSVRSSTGGTLAYMSPQQLRGQRPTVADDVYALGATLYELLTGRPPFYTGDITHQVLHESPTPVPERALQLGIDTAITESVASVIMACLAKEPEQRPQSAQAVAVWLSSEAIAVSSLALEEVPTPRRRSGLWWALGIGTAAILALVIAGLLFTKSAKQRPARVKGSSAPSVSERPTTTSSGFISLFDGLATRAWRGDNAMDFSATGWVVENGALMSVAGRTRQNLTSAETYRDFDLEFEWRVSPGGNSGIFHGPREFQILDDARHPDGKLPVTSCGSLCGVLAPGATKQLKPAGEWNQGRWVVSGRQVEHWINGERILAYTLNDELQEALRQGLARKIRGLSDAPGFAQPCDAPIVLQWHGDPVGYRNIRIKRLSDATATANGRADQGRWTNSLGMVFVPVPGADVQFSIWETRVRDFEAFVKATGHDASGEMGVTKRSDSRKPAAGYSWRNPGFPQTPLHPVVGVNWFDARAFCTWLTKTEQHQGLLSTNQAYRLPTDAEWSGAAGAGVYPWGGDLPPPSVAGNYAGQEARDADWPANSGIIAGHDDKFPRTSPVGSFAPNPQGLFDVGGNVWEWVEDVYHRDMNPVEVRKKHAPFNDDGSSQKYRVLRGASWFNDYGWIDFLRSSFHHANPPESRDARVGFRCVLDGAHSD